MPPICGSPLSFAAHELIRSRGYFEGNGIDWWDKSWGGYFMTFNDFLSFGWEVMSECPQ